MTQSIPHIPCSAPTPIRPQKPSGDEESEDNWKEVHERKLQVVWFHDPQQTRSAWRVPSFIDAGNPWQEDIQMDVWCDQCLRMDKESSHGCHRFTHLSFQIFMLATCEWKVHAVFWMCTRTEPWQGFPQPICTLPAEESKIPLTPNNQDFVYCSSDWNVKIPTFKNHPFVLEFPLHWRCIETFNSSIRYRFPFVNDRGMEKK